MLKAEHLDSHYTDAHSNCAQLCSNPRCSPGNIWDYTALGSQDQNFGLKASLQPPGLNITGLGLSFVSCTRELRITVLFVRLCVG